MTLIENIRPLARRPCYILVRIFLCLLKPAPFSTHLSPLIVSGTSYADKSKPIHPRQIPIHKHFPRHWWKGFPCSHMCIYPPTHIAEDATWIQIRQINNQLKLAPMSLVCQSDGSLHVSIVIRAAITSNSPMKVVMLPIWRFNNDNAFNKKGRINWIKHVKMLTHYLTITPEQHLN